MHIRIGFEMGYVCPQPTPMILMLSVHPSRAADLVRPDVLLTQPAVPVTAYRDLFGNWCSRLVAPQGRLTIRTDALIHDSGLADPAWPHLTQLPVEQLPESTLVFLLGSRYCETDLLSPIAWQFFGGVCRDFAHLAITLCRCMNIPARYCTGYLGDIGVPTDPNPMDFAAWFEAYLDGGWYTFDARNNTPRMGRVLMARGRDACDVALANTFGPNTLQSFRVWSDEITPA